MRYPIIILEGPDAAGKTTLAKAIGGHYIHSTYNTFLYGNMVGYVTGTMYAAKQLAETGVVVLDRWRMSEIVYGNVFRDGPEQPDLDDAFFRMAKDFGAYHVMCLPSDSNKAKYIEEFESIEKTRVEMYSSMEGVYDEYKKQAVLLSPKIDIPFVYDRFEMTPNDGVSLLLRALDQRGITL